TIYQAGGQANGPGRLGHGQVQGGEGTLQRGLGHDSVRPGGDVSGGPGTTSLRTPQLERDSPWPLWAAALAAPRTGRSRPTGPTHPTAPRPASSSSAWSTP